MRKAALLSAAVALAVPTAASASTVNQWECQVTQVTPPEGNDYDPVVRTTLETIAVGNRLTGFRVEHETMSGGVYLRQKQYRSQRIWTTSNSDNWSGAWVRDPGLTMVGTLSKNSRGLFYVERTFRGNRVERTIVHQ